VILARARRSAALAAVAVVIAACQPAELPSSTPLASASAAPSSAVPALLTAHYEVGPPPGPVKPFRGVAIQDVQIYNGWVTMRFVLRNTGEEPITFLNTLYDYEPLQLYEPLVRLEWTDGTAAASTRRGRFFPTPSTLQPGEEAVYLLGGQQILEAGSAEIADLVTHIKYCPTRGMEDTPGVPLEVSDLTWETADGITTVRGVLHQTADSRRFGSPVVGVEFSDADGNFVGAVVDDSVGAAMDVGESRSFEISGPGVRRDVVASLRAVAWVR
jgi:hypothetical protein